MTFLYPNPPLVALNYSKRTSRTHRSPELSTHGSTSNESFQPFLSRRRILTSLRPSSPSLFFLPRKKETPPKSQWPPSLYVSNLHEPLCCSPRQEQLPVRDSTLWSSRLISSFLRHRLVVARPRRLPRRYVFSLINAICDLRFAIKC